MFCCSLWGGSPAGSQGANLATAESVQHEVERPSTQVRRMCRDGPNAHSPELSPERKLYFFFSSAFLLIQKWKKKSAVNSGGNTNFWGQSANIIRFLPSHTNLIFPYINRERGIESTQSLECITIMILIVSSLNAIKFSPSISAASFVETMEVPFVWQTEPEDTVAVVRKARGPSGLCMFGSK